MKKTGSKKPASNGKAEQSGSRGEPRPKGTITTDEEGNESFEGTVDEQMAVANGGTYAWTDSEGNEHVTTVTPDGTARDHTSADGTMASSSFTPHESREEVPATDGDGTDVVVDVLNRVVPFAAGIGYFGAGFYGRGYDEPGYYEPGYYEPGYYDTGYYDPVYAAATGPNYGAAGDALPIAAAELIPEAAAGASDRGETRFTRRLLHVANGSTSPPRCRRFLSRSSRRGGTGKALTS